MPVLTEIPTLLEKMSATDTDFRFMALNDLINGLQSGTINCSHLDHPQSENMLVKSVMRLLRDGHGEVQGLAVTAVAILVQNVSSEWASSIIDELISGMCSGDTEMLRSICGVALKSLVSSLKSSQEGLVALVIKSTINPLIKAVRGHVDNTVQLEACDLIGEMMTKFGSSLSAHHSELMGALLFAMCGKNPALRKRSVHVVGAFVAYENNYSSFLLFVNYRFTASLEQYIDEKQLLRVFPALKMVIQQPMSISDFKIALQCVGVLARYPERLASQEPNLILRSLLGGVLQDESKIKKLIALKRNVGDGDPEDVADEIRELSLHILEVILRKGQQHQLESSKSPPRLLDSKVENLVPLLLTFLKHDPNYIYSDTLGEAMDTEECRGLGCNYDDDDEARDFFSEDEECDDDEDWSWKVRRAAAKTLNALIQAYPANLEYFYTSVTPTLIQRLNERIELVRLEIFACLIALLKVTAHASADPKELATRLLNPKSPQAQLIGFMPAIFQSLNPFISTASGLQQTPRGPVSNKVASPACRQAALCLIRGLLLAVPGQMASHIGAILRLVSSDFRDPSTANMVKIELVRLMQLIVKTHEFSTFAEHAALLNELVMTAISDTFYRVSLDGMDLAQSIVSLRPPESRADLGQLFPSILQQLKQTKCDLEVKEKAVSAVEVFFECLGSSLPPVEVRQCLQQLLQYLKNEPTRLITIRAFSCILKTSLTLDPSDYVRDLIRDLTALLVVNDRALRIAVLRCFSVVCAGYPEVLLIHSPDSLSTLLGALPSLVTDPRVQISQAAVQFAGELLEQANCVDRAVSTKIADVLASTDFLNPLIELVHSSTAMHGQTLEAVLLLVRSIGHFKPPNKHRFSVSFVLSRLLEPLDTVKAPNHASTASSGGEAAVRECLPNLARIIAELILQLPRTVSSGVEDGHFCSVDSVLGDMLMAAKDPATSDVRRFLHFLIFGEIGCKIDLGDRHDLVNLLLTTCTSSEEDGKLLQQQKKKNEKAEVAKPAVVSGGTGGLSELRPFAAASLGRVVVGHPAKMLAVLVGAIKDAQIAGPGEPHLAVFYLLQAMREAIVILLNTRATEGLHQHLDSLWAILLASSGRPEEGSRSLVAECLGRIALLDPQQLVQRLHLELKSPEVASSNLMCWTIIMAFKCLVSVSAENGTAVASPPQLPNISPLLADVYFNREDTVAALSVPGRLLDFLAHISHSDADVSRAAFITLNATAHHWPGLIRPLINQPLVLDRQDSLLTELYRGTVVRQELVRVVKMGPFKIYFDDGIELRKTAYECIYTLLETFMEDLSVPVLLETLVNGLRDNNHVKLVVFHILQRVTQVSPLDIVQKMGDLSGPLKDILQGQPQASTISQESVKEEEVQRCAIGLIVDFQHLPLIKKNQHFNELLRVISADAKLAAAFKSASSDDAVQSRAGNLCHSSVYSTSDFVDKFNDLPSTIG